MTDYTPIVLVLPDMDGLTNGEIRILTKETGAPLRAIQTVGRLIGQAADAYAAGNDTLGAELERQIVESGVDEADLVYALGRVALRRNGFEDTPENADRVAFAPDPKDEPS